MDSLTVILQIFAILCIIAGTLFSVIGVIGLHRLPDVYARLHAIGKVGVMGVVLLLIAAAILTPAAWGKVLILILFLLAVGPVTAHTLGSAAYQLGLKTKESPLEGG
ncbi:MAG: monovalent cation/H(+) antiporter subunit G [Chloroflexota bacterium]